MGVSGTDPLTALTSALENSTQLNEGVARSLLTMGAKRLQAGNIESALGAFKRAVSLKPDMLDAHLYVARTYSLQGDTNRAIEAYRRAVRVDTTGAAQSELANFFVQNERYSEAEKELRQLVEASPGDAKSIATLGYVFMSEEKFEDAKEQFDRAKRLAPNEAASYYNLGVLYNRTGQYEDALRELDRAVEMQHDYAAAIADRAHSYIGLDDTDAARAQLRELYNLGTDEAYAYADEIRLTMLKPAILYADLETDGFNTLLGPGTTLADLDPSLAEPGATKVFTLTFHFNQPMDTTAIQNIFNWNISKADQGGDAGYYNHGSYLYPDRQINIASVPLAVRYDATNYEATVSFRITQNENGDGLIDPSHWVFQFRGMDAYGNWMDPKGDQWDGDALGGF